MRCLLSGNDFSWGPEAMRCHAPQGNRLILSTHNIMSLLVQYSTLPLVLEYNTYSQQLDARGLWGD